ncbi:MAG: hypothetical protein PUE08_03070 [Eubacteriales bacterium]|nr:hypothetical protein [Eubacteriales bacterium]
MSNQLEKLEAYLNMLYPILKFDEYMAIQYINPDGKAGTKFYQNKQEIINYVLHCRDYTNIYCSLATTNTTESRKEENLHSTSVIALDFDYHGNGKPTPQELTYAIRNKLKINIACVVDSGNGYHVYIKINKTDKIKSWNNVTKQLQKILHNEGADPNATNKTQILRLPFTYNLKDKKKPVNCIYINENAVEYKLAKIKKIIDNYEQYGKSHNKQKSKPCIAKIEQGVPQGERNTCLWILANYYKNINPNDKESALNKCLCFNNKCQPPKKDKIIISDFNRIWNSTDGLSVCHFSDNEAKDMILRKYCSNCQKFDYKTTINKISIPKKLLEKALSIDKLNGNQISLLFYIYLNKDITKSDLYKNSFINEQTLRKYLKIFVDKRYIKIIDNRIVSIINDKNNIDIYEDIHTLTLNKKLSSSEALTYYNLVLLNYKEIFPSVIELSEYMQSDKSNISRYINALTEMQIITSQTIPNGAGIKHKLIA